MKTVKIQGIEFNVESVKTMGRTKFVSSHKALAEKKRGDAEAWYNEITGKQAE